MSLNQQFLRKEVHELKWYGLATLALTAFSVLIPLTNSLRKSPDSIDVLFFSTAVFAVYVLVNAIATFPFSSEFANNTMARLLAHPVSRKSIWNGKVLLILVLLGVPLLIVSLAAWYYSVRHAETGTLTDMVTGSFNWLAVGVVSAFFTGPLMAVALRQGLTSLLASMMAPFSVGLYGAMFSLACDWLLLNGEGSFDFQNSPTYWAVQATLCCVLAHWYARRRFLRMEL